MTKQYNTASEKAAERAVSPAESVQSIDTPEFCYLLECWWASGGGAFQRLVAHIDGEIAKAREEGRQAEEEVARLMFDDLRKARDEQAQRADAAIAGCKRWCGDGECKYACVDLDAQPLQQDEEVAPFVPAGYANETEFLRQQLKDARTAIKAHQTAFQQEGGKDEYCEAVAILRDLQSWMFDKPAGPRQSVDRLIELIAQPSDNLQQASTAQAEPAKEDTFETGYKNLVFVLRCIASGHHNSEELARNVLKHGLLPDTATPAQATPEGADLPPAEYDAAMDRHYLPLPNGWEVQTKGNGSTFRIAHVPTAARYIVMDENLHEPLTDLAKDVRAALAASLHAAEPIGEIVGFDDAHATIDLFDTNLVKHGDLVYLAAPPQQQEGEYK